MKYKLINNKTKEEHLCDKITIDGFDYYVNEDAIGYKYGISKLNEVVEIKIGYDATLYKGIICSNNPNTDCPKVVDEVEELAKWAIEETESKRMKRVWKAGYNKAKETHPFSEEDMIEFTNWVWRAENKDIRPYFTKSTKELLQLWKDQQPKTIYYDK